MIFSGVGYLCPILTEFGHNDVAYRLLQTDTFPSWGYSIKYNATTIWERWDSWTKEKGFQEPGMNSFNHFTFGSIGRWLYQSVAGIDTDNTEVGFKKILIKPNPGEGITYVSAAYKSINGLIKSHWETNGTEFVLKVKNIKFVLISLGFEVLIIPEFLSYRLQFLPIRERPLI